MTGRRYLLRPIGPSDVPTGLDGSAARGRFQPSRSRPSEPDRFFTLSRFLRSERLSEAGVRAKPLRSTQPDLWQEKGPHRSRPHDNAPPTCGRRCWEVRGHWGSRDAMTSARAPLEPADANARENHRVSGAHRQRQPRVAVPARWIHCTGEERFNGPAG